MRLVESSSPKVEKPVTVPPGLARLAKKVAVPIWGKADGDDRDVCGAPDRAGGGRPWGDEDVHRLTDQLFDNAGGQAEITAGMSRLHEDRPAFDKVLLLQAPPECIEGRTVSVL